MRVECVDELGWAVAGDGQAGALLRAVLGKQVRLKFVPELKLNGDQAARQPGNLNLLFPSIDASLLLHNLHPNVAASTASPALAIVTAAARPFGPLPTTVTSGRFMTSAPPGNPHAASTMFLCHCVSAIGRRVASAGSPQRAS